MQFLRLAPPVAMAGGFYLRRSGDREGYACCYVDRALPRVTNSKKWASQGGSTSTLLSKSVSGAGVIASRTMWRAYFVGVSPASSACSSSQPYCSRVRDKFSCFLGIAASILCWDLSYPKMLAGLDRIAIA